MREYKEGYHILIKGTIQQDTTISYAPKIDDPNFVKQISMDIRGHAGPDATRTGDVNSLLSSLDRS